MRTTLGKLMLAVIVCALAVGWLPQESWAQAGSVADPDHLKCYQITDHRTTQPPTGGLTFSPTQNPPFNVEQGCKLQPAAKPKAKFFCIPVNKDPSQPPPGQPLQSDYLCYNARCPAEPTGLLNLNVLDQFGGGAIDVKRKTHSRMICVPAVKVINPG